jgi:hypothetical protein
MRTSSPDFEQETIMAKLTTKTASVVARVWRETNTTRSPDASYCKEERVLRSDNKVLGRTVVRFNPDKCYPKGRLHDYGWTALGKTLLSGEAWTKSYLDRGWTLKEG